MVDVCTQKVQPAGLPRILSSHGDASERTCRLEIDPGLEWFRGHFPSHPVLAGIVQVHWAVMLSASWFGIELQPLEIKRLKFKNVVVPPTVLELTLQRVSETEVSFDYAGVHGRYSEGRLVFRGVSG
jgi:3-hydroxymyristoyl/3-hydroxydecanoyl-(acyl carrier protein) dehydratase